MQTAPNPPADPGPAVSTVFSYGLLAAAIGAAVSTLTVFVAFYVLNPTVITQANSVDDFVFSTTLLGGLHMLFCGPPGCLVGGLAAAVPGALIVGFAKPSRGRLLLVLAAAVVVGVLAGIVTQIAALQFYHILFPNGISFNATL